MPPCFGKTANGLSLIWVQGVQNEVPTLQNTGQRVRPLGNWPAVPGVPINLATVRGAILLRIAFEARPKKERAVMRSFGLGYANWLWFARVPYERWKVLPPAGSPPPSN